jgi:hypothetical protein
VAIIRDCWIALGKLVEKKEPWVWGIDYCNWNILNQFPKGFYKGILPPILAETPKRATKFFTFEQYKQALEPLGQYQIPIWAVRRP